MIFLHTIIAPKERNFVLVSSSKNHSLQYQLVVEILYKNKQRTRIVQDRIDMKETWEYK